MLKKIKKLTLSKTFIQVNIQIIDFKFSNTKIFESDSNNDIFESGSFIFVRYKKTGKERKSSLRQICLKDHSANVNFDELMSLNVSMFKDGNGNYSEKVLDLFIHYSKQNQENSLVIGKASIRLHELSETVPTRLILGIDNINAQMQVIVTTSNKNDNDDNSSVNTTEETESIASMSSSIEPKLSQSLKLEKHLSFNVEKHLSFEKHQSLDIDSKNYPKMFEIEEDLLKQEMIMKLNEEINTLKIKLEAANLHMDALYNLHRGEVNQIELYKKELQEVEEMKQNHLKLKNRNEELSIELTICRESVELLVSERSQLRKELAMLAPVIADRWQSDGFQAAAATSSSPGVAVGGHSCPPPVPLQPHIEGESGDAAYWREQCRLLQEDVSVRSDTAQQELSQLSAALTAANVSSTAAAFELGVRTSEVHRLQKECREQALLLETFRMAADPTVVEQIQQLQQENSFLSFHVETLINNALVAVEEAAESCVDRRVALLTGHIEEERSKSTALKLCLLRFVKQLSAHDLDALLGVGVILPSR